MAPPLIAVVTTVASPEQALRAHHPYALPAIHAWPLAPAHGPYADWVAGELAAR